jgi:hypothetical protein
LKFGIGIEMQGLVFFNCLEYSMDDGTLKTHPPRQPLNVVFTGHFCWGGEAIL